MSRVYNVLTGAARPAAPATVEAPDAPDEGGWDDGADAPFIEIGGPAGPVFSGPAATAPAAPPPAPRVAPAEAKPEPKPDTARLFPRLAPPPATPAYLSVKFHDVAGHARRTGGPDPSLVALHFPEHAVSGEYRVLRDEIAAQLPDTPSRLILFSAAAAETGTTTVLLNLAITLAHEGKARVLVVDAHVNRPAVASRLALKPAPGLCEALGGQVPLAWAFQPSPLPTLQVLAAGEPPDATAAALGRDLPRLLSQLRQWFDWVLVDAGVWGTLAERDAACPAADAVYLVTRDADAEKAEFTGLRGRVKERGGLLRGYVATRV